MNILDINYRIQFGNGFYTDYRVCLIRIVFIQAIEISSLVDDDYDDEVFNVGGETGLNC